MSKSLTWKSLLQQHDNLRKKGLVCLFDRVCILTRVYSDGNYQTAMQKDGVRALEDMDKRVSDTCANFTELAQILKMFPKRWMWERGNLAEMRGKMVAGLKKKKRGPKKERHTATLAEVREMKTEMTTQKSELEKLRAIVVEKDKTIRGLEKALESARETIGSLNETISLLKLAKKKPARV